MGLDQRGIPVFCVVPDASGQWQVKEEGFEKSLASFDEREDALDSLPQPLVGREIPALADLAQLVAQVLAGDLSARREQPLLRVEVRVQHRLRDAAGLRDVLHRDATESALREQRTRHFDHLLLALSARGAGPAGCAAARGLCSRHDRDGNSPYQW